MSRACEDWPWKLPLHARDGSVRAYALVSAEDYERFAHRAWCLDLTRGYAVGAINLGSRQSRVSVSLHREIMGLERGDRRQVDHINGDRLDNRRSNLRIVTHAQNQQNRTSVQRNNTSGFRGVAPCRQTGRGTARVWVNGRGHWIGRFDTAAEANQAASDFRREHVPMSAMDRRAA